MPPSRTPPLIHFLQKKKHRIQCFIADLHHSTPHTFRIFSHRKGRPICTHICLAILHVRIWYSTHVSCFCFSENPFRKPCLLTAFYLQWHRAFSFDDSRHIPISWTSLTNVPRYACNTVRMNFSHEPCMRCRKTSRTRNYNTESDHKTRHHSVSRKGKEDNNAHPTRTSATALDRRLSALQSATSATQELDRFSILCDSQKHTTCLDVYFSACLKHSKIPSTDKTPCVQLLFS